MLWHKICYNANEVLTMAELKIGANNLFEVVKNEKDNYILKHAEATLPLPKDEADTSINVGQRVEAFVYINHQKGLMATMIEPKIDLFRAGFVKVVEKKDKLGVFVDIGLKKDMLVSRDDLPPLKNQWPEIGDHLLCYLKVSRNQMTARPVDRFRVQQYLQPERELEKGETLTAYVYSIADEGLVLFTEEGHEIFVYHKNTRSERRVGETVEVTIIMKKDAIHYNGTLIAQKETQIEKDSAVILEYLKEHGSVDLGDKSDPGAIFETFHMSKAAFKRALGHLYKQGIVTLEKTRTTLKEEHQNG